MSLRFVHSIIIFAGIAISLIFAAYCFFSPDTAGNNIYKVGGVLALFAVAGLIAYEIHFVKKTRKLII